MLVVSAAVSLLAAGLLAGVHLTGWLMLVPLLRSLPYERYVPVKQRLDHDAPRLARPLLLTALAVTAVTVAVAVVTRSTAGAVPGVAAVAALFALVVTLVAVLRGDLPINVAMGGWDVSDPPSDWERTRARWEHFFVIRVVATSVAAVALLVAIVAVVVSGRAAG